MGVEVGPCTPSLYPHGVLQCCRFYSMRALAGKKVAALRPCTDTKSIDTNQQSNSKPKKREGGELASGCVFFFPLFVRRAVRLFPSCFFSCFLCRLDLGGAYTSTC